MVQPMIESSLIGWAGRPNDHCFYSKKVSAWTLLCENLFTQYIGFYEYQYKWATWTFTKVPLLRVLHIKVLMIIAFRDHSGYGLCQGEATSLCNAVSHGLRPYQEWPTFSLHIHTNLSRLILMKHLRLMQIQSGQLNDCVPLTVLMD